MFGKKYSKKATRVLFFTAVSIKKELPLNGEGFITIERKLRKKYEKGTSSNVPFRIIVFCSERCSKCKCVPIFKVALHSVNFRQGIFVENYS